MSKIRKPRILLISARADFGGGPEHMYRLMQILKEEIDFFVVCPEDYPYWNRFRNLLGSEKLYKIPHRKFKVGAVSNLKIFLDDNKIDLIHSHGKGAGIYGRTLNFLTGVPCIHTFHGLHTGEYKNFQKEGYLLLEKMMSKFTKAFITVSKSEFDLISKLNITRIDKINIINNGVVIPAAKVDEDIFNRAILKIITFSRFDFSKNTFLILDILQELRKRNKIDKFEIVILGSGEDEKIFIQKLAELKLSSYVKLLGSVENPAEHLVDAFCYISTSRWEGLPLGILEAMAHGIPAVATNVTGNKDLVEDNKNGFLYEIEKPEEAADKIIKLSEDKELWKSFSEAASLKIKNNFSVEKMAEQTKQLYMKNINNIKYE